MTRNDLGEQSKLDNLVEAFETARAGHGAVDLTKFLPRADDPAYPEVRRELLRVDLDWGWQEGRRRGLQDYLVLFPDLLQDRIAIEEIAFEEYRLRVLAGESPSRTEYEEKYGVITTNWATETIRPVAREAAPHLDEKPNADLRINVAAEFVLENTWKTPSCGEVAQSLLLLGEPKSQKEAAFFVAQAMTSLPEVGTQFLNFHLIAELGRGSYGCVYLARQGDLANRLVALKITIDLLGEDQKLAQLQHTNVVPVYSTHQAGSFQAVCMPYFGSTTLADALRSIRAQGSIPLSGKIVADTVRARQAELRSNQEVRALEKENAPAVQLLAQASYVDAVLWLVERLTDGLIHAHERGILHQDLKPANILLTDEGQPMLLDFNLSADVKLAAGLGELRAGGTLPYMAPEQLEALRGADCRIDEIGRASCRERVFKDV